MPVEIIQVLRGRSFRDTLFGKVRYGQALIRDSDSERNVAVVIKEYNRQLVETRMTKNGERVGEDAKEELRIHSLLCSEFPNDASLTPEQCTFLKQASQYIVQLYDVRKDDHYYYAILEFCARGEFFPLVQHEAFTPSYARHYFKQMIHGLAFMHSRRIAHRDMSLENILLSGDGVLRICDFGVAIEMADVNGRVVDAPGPPVGKVKFYMPPEVFERQPYNPFLVDVWTCGIILFVMLTKVHPFKYATRADQRFQMVLQGRINELLARWKKPLLEPCVLSLIQGMLCSADRRLTIEQICQHPYLNDAEYERIIASQQQAQILAQPSYHSHSAFQPIHQQQQLLQQNAQSHHPATVSQLDASALNTFSVEQKFATRSSSNQHTTQHNSSSHSHSQSHSHSHSHSHSSSHHHQQQQQPQSQQQRIQI